MTLALTDGALVGFLGLMLTVLVTGVTLWWQNRSQAKQIGQPNGGGSLAGDVAELRGEVVADRRNYGERLDRLDAGQLEILRRLPGE